MRKSEIKQKKQRNAFSGFGVGSGDIGFVFDRRLDGQRYLAGFNPVAVGGGRIYPFCYLSKDVLRAVILR